MCLQIWKGHCESPENSSSTAGFLLLIYRKQETALLSVGHGFQVLCFLGILRLGGVNFNILTSNVLPFVLCALQLVYSHERPTSSRLEALINPEISQFWAKSTEAKFFLQVGKKKNKQRSLLRIRMTSTSNLAREYINQRLSFFLVFLKLVAF